MSLVVDGICKCFGKVVAPDATYRQAVTSAKKGHRIHPSRALGGRPARWTGSSAK